MTKQQALSCVHTPHVLLSLLTHLAELTFSAILAACIYRDVTHRDVFFALTAGLIILPLVLVQLVSAIFLLRGQGDSMSGKVAAVMAALHVLQLGVVWRHVAVLKERDPGQKRRDVKEVLVLKLIFTLTGGVPLALLQLYLILTKAQLTWPWIPMASLVASGLSSVWSVASFPHPQQNHHLPEETDVVWEDLVSWPGFLFTLLWRIGELVARMVSLALFASLYHNWLLLVLGFHWIVMVLCISVPQTASGPWKDSTLTRRVVLCLVTSYSYVWCYVSMCDVRTAVWCTLYYVIMFLENGTLSIVWLTMSDADSFASRYLLVVISALAFLVAMVCLAVYNRQFQPGNADSSGQDMNKARHAFPKDPVGQDSGCRNCFHHQQQRHGVPVNGKGHHCPQHGAPHHCSVWMKKYRSALTSGHYYKHDIHDSFLDSASDVNSFTTAGSTKRLTRCCGSTSNRPHGAHKDCSGCGVRPVRVEGCGGGCACRGEGDGGSMVSCGTPRCCVSGCSHQQCLKVRSNLTDTTSVLTAGSGGCHNLGYEGSDDPHVQTVPAWLPSGDSLIARHLLQGTPPAEVQTQHPEPTERTAEYYRCALKRDAERWASDGYSTDHTVLEWSKLPVTSLSHNVWHINDPDTDCCTCCCYCHLSPGDSEVSSIFRAAHTAHGCPDCGGEDVVYGVPRQKVHHLQHHKPVPLVANRPLSSSSSSSSSSETADLRFAQQQQQEEDEQQQHSNKPHVFTMSSQSTCSVHDSDESAGTRRGRSPVSEGQHKVKKTKHSDKRKRQDYGLKTSNKRENVSSVNTDKSGGDNKTPSVPSTPRMEAATEHSDDNSRVKHETTDGSSSNGSEPIYQNVSVFGRDNQTDIINTSIRKNNLAQTAPIKTDSQSVQDKSFTAKKTDRHEDMAKKNGKTKVTDDEKGSYKNNQPEKQTAKSKKTVVTRTAETTTVWKQSRSNGPHRSRPRDIEEAWYVCSESEDSALPTETFSSSVEEGFTASDLDSDGSVELII